MDWGLLSGGVVLGITLTLIVCEIVASKRHRLFPEPRCYCGHVDREHKQANDFLPTGTGPCTVVENYATCPCQRFRQEVPR